MKKSRHILGLVITDGVGYRNFILSNFLSVASENFQKIFIYSGLPLSVYDIQAFVNVEVRELPVFEESFFNWFWRKSKEMAHLQLHKNFFGIADNLKANYSKISSNRGRATRFIYSFTRRFHSESFIQILEKKQQRSIAATANSRKCETYLKEDAPDFLLFTHQRPPYVVPLVSAAVKLKIPIGSFIFSWDNLASKGRMAASFEYYLVWSELMKQELLYFYPATKERKAAIVGTPQFEPYILPEYESNSEDFKMRFNLKSYLKTICYSCGDNSTSKNDELYIRTIAQAIISEELPRVNLIVRTSPAEEPHRFEELNQQFPFIQWNYPQWHVARRNHPEPWSQRLPEKEDLKVLRELLEFSDLGINMCSTMSLDFMLFDKPVINPVFGNETNGLYNDQRFLRYGHYEKVVESGAVKIAKNREELLTAIKMYLDNPEKDSENRKELIALEIGRPLKGTSQRIIEVLKEYIS